MAENIRAQRQLAIRLGFFEQKKLSIDFLEFFRDCTIARSGTNKSNWLSSYKYFADFTNSPCRMVGIIGEWLEGFKAYLLDQDISINVLLVQVKLIV